MRALAESLPGRPVNWFPKLTRPKRVDRVSQENADAEKGT
jgi:hypothetical protein